MTHHLRSAFSLLLALTLAVASVGFTQARHMAAGAQTMVICTGYGLVQITIDENGDPVEQSVPCPDCVVAQLALAPDAAPVLRPVLVNPQTLWTLRDTLRTIPAAGNWHSPRAPPLSLV
jgi:hypothetical protein